MKIKVYILLSLLCFSLAVHGQLKNSINFQNLPNWQTVLQKAKEERKMIFVDYYATWCVPCKQMDQVYANDTVGSYFNQHFVSIKIQMDTSRSDNDFVKSWYGTAHDFLKRFYITGLPAFLFFDSNGEMIGKETGFHSAPDFIEITKDCLNPNDGKRVFYQNLTNYRASPQNFTLLVNLLTEARNSRIEERELVRNLAETYKKQYLYNQTDKVLFKNDNLHFLAAYIVSTNERGFKLIYRNPAKVDSILKYPGMAESVIQHVITKEYILPKLKPTDGQRPNWNAAIKTIKKSFPIALAKQAVFKVQVAWYNNHYTNKPAEGYKDILKTIDFGSWVASPVDTNHVSTNLGNFIEDFIIPYSKDEKVLRHSLLCIEQIMRKYPGIFYSHDYAALLYRLGYRDQAIPWQEMEIRLLEEDSLRNKIDLKNDSGYQQRRTELDRMKKNENIWPLQNQ